MTLIIKIKLKNKDLSQNLYVQKSMGVYFVNEDNNLFLSVWMRFINYNFSISFMVKPVILLIVSISIFSFFIDFAIV